MEILIITSCGIINTIIPNSGSLAVLVLSELIYVFATVSITNRSVKSATIKFKILSIKLWITPIISWPVGGSVIVYIPPGIQMIKTPVF
jgi:hypothetical protein